MSTEENYSRSRVIDIPLEIETPNNAFFRNRFRGKKPEMGPSVQRWWLDVVGLILMGAAVLVSSSFWNVWLSKPDGQLYLGLAGLGFVIAIVRTKVQGNVSVLRATIGSLIWMIALAMVIYSVATVRPKVGVTAIAFVLIGWGLLRASGEGYAYGAGLSSAWLIPLFIDEAQQEGWLSWIEPLTMTMTSRVADLFKISNARDAGSIVFQQGVAETFSPIGTWDSPLTLLGLGVGLMLCFRRAMVVGVLSLTSSVFVWLAMRSLSWLSLIELSLQSGEWIGWSVQVGLVAFLVTVIAFIMTEQFIATIFHPINQQYLNVDYPLLVMTWNWIFGLPRLTVQLPVREMDVTPIDNETELQ